MVSFSGPGLYCHDNKTNTTWSCVKSAVRYHFMVSVEAYPL